MLEGMGLPWRVHPMGWSELCQWAMTSNRVSEGIKNCTVEQRNTIINFTGFNKISLKKKPKLIIVRGHNVKGFICFNITQNINRICSAGTSQCKYYTTPSCNATLLA